MQSDKLIFFHFFILLTFVYTFSAGLGVQAISESKPKFLLVNGKVIANKSDVTRFKDLQTGKEFTSLCKTGTCDIADPKARPRSVKEGEPFKKVKDEFTCGKVFNGPNGKTCEKKQKIDTEGIGKMDFPKKSFPEIFMETTGHGDLLPKDFNNSDLQDIQDMIGPNSIGRGVGDPAPKLGPDSQPDTRPIPPRIKDWYCAQGNNHVDCVSS